MKKCGIRHIAIASFKHMTQTGEEFLKQLRGRGEIQQDHFAFVEFLDSDEPPQGLLKCREFGIKNVVLELDLMFRGKDCIHRGVNHSLEIPGNPYKKSEISYVFFGNPFEKLEISYAKCLSDLPLVIHFIFL